MITGKTPTMNTATADIFMRTGTIKNCKGCQKKPGDKVWIVGSTPVTKECPDCGGYGSLETKTGTRSVKSFIMGKR